MTRLQIARSPAPQKEDYFRRHAFFALTNFFRQKRKQNDQLLVKFGKWQQSRAQHPVNLALPMVHNNNQVTHSGKLQSLLLRTLP